MKNWKSWKRWLYETAEVAVGLLLALIVFVLGLVWLTDTAEAETMFVNVSPSSHLNGRSRAGTGEIVAKLQRGWPVEVVAISHGWALVDGYGEDGHCWVSAQYLSESQPKPIKMCEAQELRTTVSKLLVRSCPGGSVVGRIEKKGTRVTVTGKTKHDGVWWGYLGNGRWVMMRFLGE